MASPPVIDIDALVAPIPGDKPTGLNLREDPSSSVLYYQVKDARNAARIAERNAIIDDEGGGEPADWRSVRDLAKQVLTENSKSLEISAWLIEALVRMEGFAGMRDGFTLTRRLIEEYWDDLYPEPDEDGIETKVAPLTGLNGEGGEGTLIVPIKCIPITTDVGSVGPFASFQYDQSREVGRITDDEKKKQKIAAGYISPEDFETSVRETSAEMFQSILEDIQGSLDEFAAMNAALTEKAGDDAPPSTNIKTAVETVQSSLAYITRDILSPAEAEPAEAEAGDEAQESEGGVAAAAKPKAGSDQISSREDAFRLIKKVADFFRNTEPHSPLPYALEQSIRWGRMPLPDLLKEVISDDTARSSYFRLTGIPEGDD
ncbi:MAG: type VI secretion system protein ImpA [Planctomycetota bacterium]|jgi:type VI secretion system protein ImpA